MMSNNEVFAADIAAHRPLDAVAGSGYAAGTSNAAPVDITDELADIMKRNSAALEEITNSASC